MKEDSLDRPWGISAADGLLMLTAVIWGVNFSVVKFALVEIPQLAFMGLRFVVASGTMLALTVVTGRSLRFERRHLLYLIGLGLLGNTAYQLFFVYGISFTTAENSSLILATSPAWVALIGTFIGFERVRPAGWFGIAFSLLGIFLIIWGSDRLANFPFGGSSLKGDFLMLAGTLCWSLYTLLMRPMTRYYSSISITAFTTAVGTIPLVLIGIPTFLSLDWGAAGRASWLALVFSGIFAIGLAYFFWNYGVSQIGSARTSIYSNLTIPAALITAWIWLQETLTPAQWLGTFVAVAGIILARRFTKHQA